MLVKELMTPDPVCCTPETPLREVAQLMAENDCGAIPVCEGPRVVGIITDRDIVTRGLIDPGDPLTRPASWVMTRNLMTVHDDDNIEHAMRVMESEQVRRLPVTQDDTLVGMLSITDLADHLPERKAGELLREVSDRPRRTRMAL